MPVAERPLTHPRCRRVTALLAQPDEVQRESSCVDSKYGNSKYGNYPLAQGLGIGHFGSAGIDVMRVLWDIEVVMSAFAAYFLAVTRHHACTEAPGLGRVSRPSVPDGGLPRS
ncbi:hypothetical protein OG884_17105 [Streptosporangium sp. NBC_01755]|uniref:hypothetical protein n=1 Tax=unclassified Streptosporangium TaxID=2632669 RepID=UPI002DD8759B|nr:MULTISPECIES: hypothetical protein [unclassified Streptosporangium]WSA25126.1 hypothetical protein OIE13_30010 [Streptosporangium sp. NBC_01810]WSD03533.1 hypothetical protein OG884_17105 [Streptosporangium sp. NBC_01755]